MIIIKIEKKRLVEDTREYNLYCTRCRRNCHLNCNEWGLLVWKPVSACDVIEDDYCLKCYCHKDRHEREKYYYEKYEEEESLSPQSKKKIDDEISKLEKNIKNITMDTIKSYDYEIEEVEKAYKYKENREIKNIERYNLLDKSSTIRDKQKEQDRIKMSRQY